MVISDRRLNKLVGLAVDGAMSVLTAGLPEFPKSALAGLKEDIEMHLSDTIESHIAALTEDEYRKSREPQPFGDN